MGNQPSFRAPLLFGNSTRSQRPALFLESSREQCLRKLEHVASHQLNLTFRAVLVWIVFLSRDRVPNVRFRLLIGGREAKQAHLQSVPLSSRCLGGREGAQKSRLLQGPFFWEGGSPSLPSPSLAPSAPSPRLARFTGRAPGSESGAELLFGRRPTRRRRRRPGSGGQGDRP